ncbi:MAG: hypothetical protein H7841_06445, partial [Magnetospirillum sp. WYHS-4]
MPGEDNIHIAKAVDTLAGYSDPGDHPRWTAREIRMEGPTALARTRATIRGLQERAPDLADTYLRRLLIGEAEPERIPVGVLKAEWEKRRSSDTMECTPEKCPPVTPRPLGT